MAKILYSALKELLLLSRDRSGLLTLFLMPSVLVVIITLVQQNVLELSGQQRPEILLDDQDGGIFAEHLRSFLTAAKLTVVDYSADMGEGFQELVNDGRFQVGLFLPAGTSGLLQQRIADSLGGRAKEAPASPPSLELSFDPASMAGFRVAMVARLQMAAKAAQMELAIDHISETVGSLKQLQMPGMAELPSTADLKRIFAAGIDISERPTTPGKQTFEEVINPVNRNVPAWALFGMFFTAIPIAGGVLAERRSGIAVRLSAMPVSPLQLQLGRIAAYILVCSCQLIVIGLIGIHLFPLLDLPAFAMPAQPLYLLPPFLASALAACALGTCLGSLCRSFEQASTLGATAVVVAAALGGVMVPVYAMPEFMQHISLLSPLNWSLNAFLDLLVRSRDISAIWPDVILLLLFSTVMVLLSRRPWSRR